MAEKYLKAFLTANNVEFPKVHDIVHLLDNYCIPLNENLRIIRDEAILLTDFAVLPRYPGDFGIIEESEAREAFEAALKIKEAIIKFGSL
jgi:HEPN domain-containing protein